MRGGDPFNTGPGALGALIIASVVAVGVVLIVLRL